MFKEYDKNIKKKKHNFVIVFIPQKKIKYAFFIHVCIQFEVGKWDKSGGIQKAHNFPCFLGASKQNMNFLV